MFVSPKYRPDIDGLRAVAVLSVVFYHYFPNLLKGGFVGVDIFFVISGYLISMIIFSNLEKDSFSFSEFYIKRIKRIFPGLFLVLASFLVLGWRYLFPDDFANLGKHVSGGAAFISNLVLWSETDYFDSQAIKKPLLHLWSLGIEEQFYIIWPFLAFAIWRVRRHLHWVILTLLCGSFFLNIILLDQFPSAAFYLPFSRFWELLCGTLLAWIMLFQDTKIQKFYAYTDRKLSWILLYGEKSRKIFFGKRIQIRQDLTARIIFIIGKTCIFVSLLIIDETKAFPGFWAVLPVVGTLLIILTGHNKRNGASFLSYPLSVWFGLISFPLYLWHWPILSFYFMEYGSLPGIMLSITLITLSVLLSAITYYYIEKPIRFYSKTLLTPFILILSIAFTGSSGWIIYKEKGFPNRFAKILNFSTIPLSDWVEMVRGNRCHLQDGSVLVYAKECTQSRHPSVAIWGDSHAAALYPGLKNLQEEYNFGLSQYTMAACPPIFSVKSIYLTHCEQRREEDLELLKNTQPDILLMYAAWKQWQYPLANKDIENKLRLTIQRVKKELPATRLVLIGPVPRWHGSPLKEAFKIWKASADRQSFPPVYLTANILNDVNDIIQRITNEENVEFISAIDILCENDKCISRTGDNSEDFIAIDEDHFSKNGSIFFINKIKENIFSDDFLLNNNGRNNSE